MFRIYIVFVCLFLIKGVEFRDWRVCNEDWNFRVIGLIRGLGLAFLVLYLIFSSV